MPDELDVECACVFQGHPVLEGGRLNSQRRPRRVFKLAEAPLVGVADEGQLSWADDLVGRLRRLANLAHFLMLHQAAGLHQGRVETRAHEAVVVIPVAGVHLAVEHALPPEEMPAGVTGGGWENLTHSHLPPGLPAAFEPNFPCSSPRRLSPRTTHTGP